jgi:ubiquinone/menaquinone biosynthesis C-methylase UbiE
MTETVSTELQPSPPSRPWLRVMARIYDPFVWLGETAGMRSRRRAAISDAHGRVVEIGAGTGLNIGLYPDGITELILTEPDEAMRRRLALRLRRTERVATIVDAPAERLPLADASVDTVVSTLVLCTVGDPQGTLTEIARVLRPGGQLLFVEHVRSNSRALGALQDLLFRPWRAFAGGCCSNRETVELIRAAGFDVVAREDVWRGMPAIVRPLVVGRAGRPA